MRKTKHVIAARAGEPSTHAGLALLAQAVGAFFPQYAGLATAATAVFGALAVAMPEKSGL